MLERGLKPAIPPNSAPHITEWLFDMGPVLSGGMGMSRLEWRDIRAWQDQMGIELAPWEARLIRALSGTYLSMAMDAKDETCPAPYTNAETIRLNREALSEAATNNASIQSRADAFRKAKERGDHEAMARILQGG